METAQIQTPQVKRGPGRPKLVLNDTSELKIVKNQMELQEAAEKAAPINEPIVKRGPGRPRKDGTPAVAKATSAAATIAQEPATVKRSPGRPKKVVEATQPQLSIVKRGPGRPKKETGTTVALEAKPIEEPVVKRSPGRPRKQEAVAVQAVADNTKLARGRKPKELMVNNQPAKHIKLDEYAVFYAEKGLEDYKQLIIFMQKHSIPVKMALGLLSGATQTPSDEALDFFKLGKFRIKDMVHAEKAATLRTMARNSAPGIYHKVSFTNALARIVAMDNFQQDHFEKNLTKSFMGLESVDTIEGYERQLIEIHNAHLPKKQRLTVSV
jgi:hypothetical protein